MHGDSVALATRQRTGSVWGKRKDGEEWIANTERRGLPPKTFTFIRCVATYNENSVVTLFSHTDLFQIVRRGKQIREFYKGLTKVLPPVSPDWSLIYPAPSPGAGHGRARQYGQHAARGAISMSLDLSRANRGAG